MERFVYSGFRVSESETHMKNPDATEKNVEVSAGQTAGN